MSKCMMCGLYPAHYLVLTPHHKHAASTVCKQGCASLVYDFVKQMHGQEAANALRALHKGKSPDAFAPAKVVQMFGNMSEEQKHEAAELYYRLQMKAKARGQEESGPGGSGGSKEE